MTRNRRPCERRDPYAVSPKFKQSACGQSRVSIEALGLWIPAFAGTTWVFFLMTSNTTQRFARYQRHHRARRRGEDGRCVACRAGCARGWNARRVVVIEPHPSDEISGGDKSVRLNPSPTDIGATATLVIALKPQSFREAGAMLNPSPGLRRWGVDHGGHDHRLDLRGVRGSVVRAMPKHPAAIGRGITVAVAAGDVSSAQGADRRRAGSPPPDRGMVDDENLMDAVTAVSVRSG